MSSGLELRVNCWKAFFKKWWAFSSAIKCRWRAEKIPSCCVEKPRRFKRAFFNKGRPSFFLAERDTTVSEPFSSKEGSSEVRSILLRIKIVGQEGEEGREGF